MVFPSSEALLDAVVNSRDFGGDQLASEHKSTPFASPIPVGVLISKAFPADVTESPDDGSSLEARRPVLRDLNLQEKAVSAAMAAFVSAIIMNPLDIAKTRLQAQAAGAQFPHAAWDFSHQHPEVERLLQVEHCPSTCPRIGNSGAPPLCPPQCYTYQNTWDVLRKIWRQEGPRRLWRGTNASLAIAVPTVGIYLPLYDVALDYLERGHEGRTRAWAPLVAGAASRSVACLICSPLELARTRMQAMKEVRSDVRPLGMWGTLAQAVAGAEEGPRQNWRRIGILWRGVGAQLARDVPFSAICWASLEPIRRRLLEASGPDPGPGAVVGANFIAGNIAGAVAAAATCPLDVVKTRRQIEMDPARVRSMGTLRVLREVYREAGMRGLFTGWMPRTLRAGPAVGIVVSSYEAAKYMLHRSPDTRDLSDD